MGWVVRHKILGFIVCAFLTAPALGVPVFEAYAYRGYTSEIGGEVTAVISDWDWDVLQYYADSTKNVGQPNSFQTFCLEISEPIEADVTYEVTFSDRARAGGVTGGGPMGDPISVGTAWLYQEFIKGTLEGYDYAPGDINPPADHRQLSAGYLQYAIWWLEGEIYFNPDNIFSNAAIDKFGSIASAMEDNNGRYNVMIMNNWGWNPDEGDYSALIQDTLVFVNPEPATVFLLGLGGLVLLRRRY